MAGDTVESAVQNRTYFRSADRHGRAVRSVSVRPIRHHEQPPYIEQTLPIRQDGIGRASAKTRDRLSALSSLACIRDG